MGVGGGALLYVHTRAPPHAHARACTLACARTRTRAHPHPCAPVREERTRGPARRIDRVRAREE